MASSCPRCGAARGGGRYCSSCAYDFWGAAAGRTQTHEPPGPETPSPQPPESPAPTKSSGRGWQIAAAVIIGIGLVYGAWAIASGQIDLGGGSVAAQDVPPVGSVWFGSSFDPGTFAISNRKTTVGTNEAFVAVAHLPRSLNAASVFVRISWDGELVTTQQINASGSGDVWGINLGPLFQAGRWRYEFADVGGNVLAAGTVTAQ